MAYPRKQSPEAWAQQLDFAGLERKHGLPSGILTNLVRQESQGDCMAGSRKGAYGLCQFMPETARAAGSMQAARKALRKELQNTSKI